LKKGRRRRQSVTGPSVPHRPPRFAQPKGHLENPQKYFQKVTFFRARKTTTLITTKNHQLTTFSPQKNHPKNAQKRATPCKKRGILSLK
jgi:hypothetical protein